MKSEQQNHHCLTPINAFNSKPSLNVRFFSGNEEFMQRFHGICLMQVNFLFNIIIGLIKGTKSIIKLLTFIKKPSNKWCTPSFSVNIPTIIPTTTIVNNPNKFYTNDKPKHKCNVENKHFNELLLDEANCAIDATTTTTTPTSIASSQQPIYWIKLNHSENHRNHHYQNHSTATNTTTTTTTATTRIHRYQSNSNDSTTTTTTTISNKFYRRTSNQSTLLKLFGFLMLFTSVLALPPVVRIGKLFIYLYCFVSYFIIV